MTDHPSHPEAIDGYYLFREMIGRKENGRGIFTEYRPCRIWYGPPLDPETGEELDRSWRWQATLAGEEVALERIWPWAGLNKITEEAYLNALAGEYNGYEQRTNGEHGIREQGYGN